MLDRFDHGIDFIHITRQGNAGGAVLACDDDAVNQIWSDGISTKPNSGHGTGPYLLFGECQPSQVSYNNSFLESQGTTGVGSCNLSTGVAYYSGW